MYNIRSSLSSIMIQKKGICRSQSYENIRGEKGQAAQTTSELGKSRKGTPFLRNFQPGETCILADIEGRGIIRQFFITVTDQQEMGPLILEKLILRMYWDNETVPAVECPLGDFFGCAQEKIVVTEMEPFAKDRKYVNNWDSIPVQTLSSHSPIFIVPARSFHSYFPMPFNSHAKITLENCYGAAVSVVAYQVTYTLESYTEALIYRHFHAKHAKCQWQLETDELLLDTISVSGKENSTYAGIYLSARLAGRECKVSPLLKISSFSEEENIWYELVAGDDLSNGGWQSFRMENPIQFERELNFSLVPFFDTINEKTEFVSMIYWYE